MANSAKSTFDQKFIDDIKTKLLEERVRLEKELAGFTSKSKTVPGDFDAKFSEYGDDEDSNVQEIEEFTVNKPLEMSLENSLRDVNKALKRIEEGAYGICKYCDRPIDEKRLLARPTSSACVSCKKLLTDEA
jgi:RNA polymerase-binding transcription factor DksA